MRAALISLLSLMAALLALVALFSFAGASIHHVGERLVRFGPLALGLVCTASLAQIAISAIKWRIALSALGTLPAAMPSAHLSMLLSSLSAVAAQIVPQVIAASALRSLTARYISKTPILEGALASAVEQSFDVLAFTLFAIPTFALLALGLAGVGAGFSAWAAVAIAAVGVAFALIGVTSAWFARRIGSLLQTETRPSAALRTIARIDASVQRRLLLLSILRYGAIFARVIIVALAAGFAFPIDQLLYGHTVVQAAQLASVTPGNLGISEWTWVGALAYHGHDPAEIAIFSLTMRVVSVASYVLVSGLATVCFAGTLFRASIVPRL